MIGDRSGLAPGMKVIGVRAGNFAQQPQDEADLVVDTLVDVSDKLLASLFV